MQFIFIFIMFLLECVRECVCVRACGTHIIDFSACCYNIQHLCLLSFFIGNVRIYTLAHTDTRMYRQTEMASVHAHTHTCTNTFDAFMELRDFIWFATSIQPHTQQTPEINGILFELLLLLLLLMLLLLSCC